MSTLRSSLFGVVRTDSATYRIKTPIHEHAMYFTIMGGRHPIAFFVNSKEMESFQFIVGLMTSWSRQIEAGVPICELVRDMKNTFDPKGSYIVPGTARMVNSVVHHMGLILERHINDNSGECI